MRATVFFILSIAISGCEKDNDYEIINRSVLLGVYDPDATFILSDKLDIEHIFVSWARPDKEGLTLSHHYASARKRTLMVTIEPFSTPPKDPRSILDDTISGDYDVEIHVICSTLGSLGSEVLIRWGHEMEGGRYPWSGAAPYRYVAAYRYFVQNCRSRAPNAKYIWSPMGMRNLEAYYPGRNYVDYVGMSVWAFAIHGRARFLGGNLLQKYGRVVQFGLPIMIAEAGVAGSFATQQRWIAALLTLVKDLPHIHAVVYFNAKEPHQYPGIGSPDWRISPEAFPPDGQLTSGAALEEEMQGAAFSHSAE